MIDIHCHILPGLDDGPADLETSLDMVRRAQAAGIRTIVATPHVRRDYPLTAAIIAAATVDLRGRLADAGLEVEVLPGAEIGLARAAELGDDELRRLCLGTGSFLLLECPRSAGTTDIEAVVFDLQLRGFRPVLAHPERCPAFQRDPGPLAGLVARGALCSVTAGSLSGRFGAPVRRLVLDLLRRGLVHNLASDAHDPLRRPPDLRPGLEALGEAGREGAGLAGWLVRDVPQAMLSGASPPRPPATMAARGSRRWRRG